MILGIITSNVLINLSRIIVELDEANKNIAMYSKVRSLLPFLSTRHIALYTRQMVCTTSVLLVKMIATNLKILYRSMNVVHHGEVVLLID
jgi:hypothetical protein